MEQLIGVFFAWGVYRFTPVQNEKETVYIPSTPSSVNLSDASFSLDDEMIKNKILNIQSDME